MTASRDPDRLIQHFLAEGAEQLHDQVYDAVRSEIEHQPQRAVIGPWRMPTMNKLVPIGLGAAAVFVALVVGPRLLGPPAPGGVGGIPSVAPSVAPSPSAAPSVATPSAKPSGRTDGSLPDGSYVATGSGDPVQVTFNIASSGWQTFRDFDGVSKEDDGLDAPKTVGAALLAWAWPAGIGINVYGDPCKWRTTIPKTPATTPAQIAAAFAAQTTTDVTAPVDVTVGGFAGKKVTLRVPLSFDLPNGTREEKFAACDDSTYAFYGLEGNTDHERNAQGAGQIDELWILDVNGSIVILDAASSPATRAEVVEEMRAMAGSATFKAP